MSDGWGDIVLVEDWAPAAACRQAAPDELFVRGAEQNKAKVVCGTCPVRTECLAEALDNQIEWGVWGGMTERERRALLRRKPAASWRSVLAAAKAGHTDRALVRGRPVTDHDLPPRPVRGPVGAPALCAPRA